MANKKNMGDKENMEKSKEPREATKTDIRLGPDTSQSADATE